MTVTADYSLAIQTPSYHFLTTSSCSSWFSQVLAKQSEHSHWDSLGRKNSPNTETHHLQHHCVQ